MSLESNNFHVKLTLRLDWSEMDMFGHINNVMFMKFIQASRVNYWEKIGIDQDFRKTGIGPMLASTSCQFKKPLFYPGNILVEASVISIGNTSFKLNHRIWDQKGELAATGEDVVVLFDFNKNEKVVIPEEIRKMIEKIESNQF